MSYQVIARKWRPQTFEEVTGQDAITRTLRNAVEFGRLHHAYLFSGARGVGKTTVARLLAKALNCRKTEAPNPVPCSINDPDPCPSCREISESRSIDVFEFDAASNTQVEKIRDIILEGINVAPARDRFKVFIIDEVHMLSTHSFNALLKTVEEPPPNVVFIMATTELHKVPETILSRCQQFEFRTISNQKIFERLRLIADAEDVSITDEALREIARTGEGSMRDAQSNFDQVISFSGEKIDKADVSSALGIAGAEALSAVLDAIVSKEPAPMLKVVDDLVARGHDLRNFCRDLLAVIRDLFVFKTANGDDGLLETAVLDRESMERFTSVLSGPDLLRIFHSIAETEAGLREATQPRYMLEIGLVKLVEMQRMSSMGTILERLMALEKAVASGTPVPCVEPAAKPQQSAATEKKTLTSETNANSFETPTALPALRQEEPAATSTETTSSKPAANGRSYDLSFLDSIKVALPEIEPQMLEHFDDTWLDNAYEQRMILSGDLPQPIPQVHLIAELAIGAAASQNGISSKPETESVTTSVRPVNIPFLPKPEQLEPLPELSAEPTKDELFAYANAHPLVKQALKIFNGEILEVKKS